MQFKNVLVSATVLYFISVADAWSPTNSYAPATVQCDADINLVREAKGISKEESDWLAKREVVTKDALKTFLDRVTKNFADNSIVDSIFSTTTPRVGFAACGGGYRGMLLDAGVAAAMDDRTPGSTETGLGGLLQGTSYMSGVSGGAFFTSTLAFNNWTSVQDIINQMNDGDHSIWDISQSPLSPGGSDTAYTDKLFGQVVESIHQKYQAGFAVSLADAYGMITGSYMYPGLPDFGASYQWSDLLELDVFKNGGMPLIIEVAGIEAPGVNTSTLGATTIELSPFEFGSWEPTIRSFTSMKYLGTTTNNGKPTTKGECVSGYDNVNFITTASTNVINYIYSQGNAVYNSMIDNFATKFLPNITTTHIDVNIINPNPFKGTSFYETDNSLVDTEELYLVDGGYGGQVIPFTPLMRQERGLDVVIATDNSFDTKEIWPNGNSIISTYERQFMDIGKTDAFPYVPDYETFADLGLTQTPTFFGCDSSNLTDLAYVPPLVIYLPNREYSFASNISTYTFTYTKEERLAMIQNGYEIATRNKFADDADFAGCIGCAVMRRKQEKLGLKLPKECEQCFERYCWNGTISHGNTAPVTNSTDNSTTTLTTTDLPEYSTFFTTSGIDALSTIHSDTSTTVTCHECEEGHAQETGNQYITQASWTTTTERCHECEAAEQQSNASNHYITSTSLTTTTSVCEECEQAKATATGSNSFNSSKSASNIASQTAAIAAPTVAQVQSIATVSTSAVNILVNQNAASSMSAKGVVALLTIFVTIVVLL